MRDYDGPVERTSSFCKVPDLYDRAKLRVGLFCCVAGRCVQMAVCKWQGGRNHKGVPVAKVGAELVRRLTTGRPPLPPDPLGFGSVYRIAGYKEWRPPKGTRRPLHD